jgi:hypothetical protein
VYAQSTMRLSLLWENAVRIRVRTPGHFPLPAEVALL